jgi:nicotinate dehydrogenase subunit B
VTWSDQPPLAGNGNLFKQMHDFDEAGQAPAHYTVKIGDVDKALNSAAHVASGRYMFPYNGGMPIGPPCAVADVTPGGARILTYAQGIYAVRKNVKDALDKVLGARSLPLDRIRVTYYEGSSSYGTTATQADVAQGAAIMSALTGKPVRLQLMRWDEHGWNYYGPAQMTDVRGGVDANGNIVAYDFTTFAIPYGTINAASVKVGLPLPTLPLGESSTMNRGTGAEYNLANWRITAKSLPLRDNYFIGKQLRAPLVVQSAFASEQMIDELACAARMDPIAFRRQNILGSRWFALLDAVAQVSNWQPRVSGSKLSNADVVTGRGIGIATGVGNKAAPGQTVMAAAVADIEVNKTTGKILVKQVYVADDSGLAISPGLMENQMSGQVIQATSRALLEEVRFDKARVTSLDWVTYPILRFRDAPKVTTITVSRPDMPADGASEDVIAPTVAAIANAFFDATGVRIRQAPMTPSRVRAVLKAAGVA